MKNCLVIGSGRSGTSMVAGTLAGAGYFMGKNVRRKGDGSNPKGYFESYELGKVNEEIVYPMMWIGRKRRLLRWGLTRLRLKEPLRYPLFNEQLRKWTRWLAMVPVDAEPKVTPEITETIQDFVSQEPYCYKSPLFCYTLPAWRPYLRNTVYLCVFREPQRTAASIVKEVQVKSYLEGITITFEEALETWTLLYRHILEKHRFMGDWLFIHYNQVLTPEGLDRLEALIEAPVDRSFPEARLSRSRSDEPIPAHTAAVYRQLCELAGYDDDGQTSQ